MKTLIKEKKITHSTPTEVQAGEDPNQTKATERDAGSNEPRPDPANQRGMNRELEPTDEAEEARARGAITLPLLPLAPGAKSDGSEKNRGEKARGLGLLCYRSTS